MSSQCELAANVFTMRTQRSAALRSLRADE
jgi:hypothetical protein